MEDLRNWTEILLESSQNLINGFVGALPRLVAGMLLLLLGWLLARFLSRMIARALKAVRFNQLMERAQVVEFLQRAKVAQTPSQIVGKFIYWILMLLILVGFAETLKLTIVSQKIGVLINYLPNIFIAFLILIGGLFLANRLKEFIQTSLSSYSVRANRFIGSILYYLLAVFIILTALEQLQFDVALLSSNVMILLGGVALAFAIGYGLAAREIFPNIISSYYSKNTFKIGDTIRSTHWEGEIVEITNLSVVIKTQEGLRYVPAKKLIIEEIEVLTA
jgi:hypothetical protein